jgi:hypothetical protein
MGGQYLSFFGTEGPPDKQLSDPQMVATFEKVSAQDALFWMRRRECA